MNLVLVNIGTTPQVVTDPDGDNVNGVQPGDTLTINDARQVLIVGDKPSVREQIEQAVNIAADFVRAIIRTIAGRRAGTHTDAVEEVSFRITNQGSNAVRVILGDGVNEQTVSPGATSDLKAPGYLELRELGQVQQDPNQHEAA